MHIETPEKIFGNGVFRKWFEKLSALKLRHIFHKTIKWENFSLQKIRYVLLVPPAVLVWTIAENRLKWMGFQMRRQWYGQLRAIWKRYLRWKHFCFNLLETKTDTYENVSPYTNCNGRGGGVEDFWGNHVVVKEGGRGKQSSPTDRVQSEDYRKSTANEEGIKKDVTQPKCSNQPPPPTPWSVPSPPAFSWALGHFLISYFEFWFHPYSNLLWLLLVVYALLLWFSCW